MKITDILKMVAGGAVVLYMLIQLIMFYGGQSSDYYIYGAFFMFLMVSTAILELQDPLVE
tara:strand:+ start:3462 stop:3641 length:180 start_codon:yes stop_codon:yes gene_type:complete